MGKGESKSKRKPERDESNEKDVIPKRESLRKRYSGEIKSVGFTFSQLHDLQSYYNMLLRETDAGLLTRETFDVLFHPGGADSTGTFAAKLFDMLDVSKDGSVHLEEFIQGMALLCLGTADDKLQFLFRLYDVDNNGYITIENYRNITAVALSLSQTVDFASSGGGVAATVEVGDMDEHFRMADVDHDGKLTFDEFTHFVQSHPGLATVHALESNLRAWFKPSILHIKLALVGPPLCGKTTVVRRFLHDEFSGKGIGTSYNYTQEREIDGTHVSLVLRDSDAHNRQMSYKGADAVIVCCPITFTEGLMDDIKRELVEYAADATKVLIGTKCDLRSDRLESCQPLTALLKLRDEIGAVEYFECGLNSSHEEVDAMFVSAITHTVPAFILRPTLRNIQVALLGPPDGGKSELVSAFLKPEPAGFSYRHHKTVELDGTRLDVTLVDSDSYNRQLAYRGTDVAVIVVPVDCRDYAIVETINGEIEEACPEAPVVLVASKTDLRGSDARGTEEMLSNERGHAIQRSIGASLFIECSAREHPEDVPGLFTEIFRLAIPNISLCPSHS